jgi:adenylate cyclase
VGLRVEHVPELAAFLAGAPHVADGGESLLVGLVAELVARGLPLSRANVALLTMHPEVFWRNVQWHADAGVKVFLRNHLVLGTSYFIASPVAELREGAAPIRVQLTPGPLPYPVCEDLRADGGTDYLALGLAFTNGEISYASFTTKAPGGFDDDAIAALRALGPALARRIELESAYYATSALLEVYLGHNAARRVLAGAFRRGGGELIDAAIWFCDLRGFTEASDRLPPGEVVRMLDAYFDHVAGPIAAHGGDVLKFIGDAVLAIFPVELDGGARGACTRALGAAEEAIAALDALSAERVGRGEGALRMGVALHLGQVMYGNVGAKERLDFTVISSSVNEACRLEALCKPLGARLTMSAAFVAAGEVDDAVDLGEHQLKGVAASARVYTLARLTASTA